MSAIVKTEDTYFPASKIEIFKQTLGKNLTNEEVMLFAEICRSVELNPFIKQIYPIKRRSKDDRGNYVEKMVPQVGIDGLRSIAERTGKYCPGKEATFVYNENGHVISATAYVKKMTADGTWHEVSSTAFWNEYSVSNNNFWKDKPHIMIAKCAEALCIRKAFPSVTGNLYIAEEMGRAGTPLESNEMELVVQPITESEIIDPRANKVSSEPSSNESWVAQLISKLSSDGVPIEKFNDVLENNCKKKKATPEEVAYAWFNYYNPFKDWYLTYLGLPVQRTA